MLRFRTIPSVLALAGCMFWYDPDLARGADEECGTTSTLGSDLLACAEGDCPRKGSCDCPATRDDWTPEASTSEMTIRVKFNVFHSALIGDEALMYDQWDKIDRDFEAHKIQFDVVWDFFPGTPYGEIDTNDEVDDMKIAYADNPGQQLNVYVVDILIDANDDGEVDYYGRGVYPWTSYATDALGGVMVDGDRFGSSFTLLTHEIGHVLGLWHTFHGSDYELMNHGGLCVTPGAIPCDYCCYESAECTGLDPSTGDCPNPDCELTGDFCCDTPGTPEHRVCEQVPDTDICPEPDVPWEPSGYHNFMGYTPQACRTEFTTHQSGRMHCWICDELAGWTATGGCTLPDGSCQLTGERSADPGVRVTNG